MKVKAKLAELDKTSLTSREKMAELINFSNNLGFLFTDIMSEIVKGDNSCQIQIELKTIHESLSSETTSASYASAKKEDPPESDVVMLSTIRRTSIDTIGAVQEEDMMERNPNIEPKLRSRRRSLASEYNARLSSSRTLGSWQ